MSNIKDLILKRKNEFERSLPAYIKFENFCKAALLDISQNESLLESTQVSVLRSLVCAAQLGLMPSAITGEAYLVPYRNKKTHEYECKLIIGYKGFLKLLYQNKNIVSLEAETVFVNDEFYCEYGTNKKLIHKPAIKDRGEPVCYYSIVYFKGQYNQSAFKMMTIDEINEIMTMSQSSNSKMSPWQNNFNEMAKKTVIRRHMKLLPIVYEDYELSSKMQSAITIDEMSDIDLQPAVDVDIEDKLLTAEPKKVLADSLAREITNEAN